MREARELQTQIEQLERHIANLDKQLQDVVLAKPEMPTKIIGPNLEEILNAAGFYRGDAVCCNDYEKCIKPCTPKGEWLAKKELAKTEQAEYDKLTVKFGERAKEYLEAAKKSWEQEPVAWRNAAIRLGEDLYSVGPNGYYEMTAKQWLDWALSVVNTTPSRKEWVGLSINEGRDFFESKLTRAELIAEINEFLEEKNT